MPGMMPMTFIPFQLPGQFPMMQPTPMLQSFTMVPLMPAMQPQMMMPMQGMQPAQGMPPVQGMQPIQMMQPMQATQPMQFPCQGIPVQKEDDPDEKADNSFKPTQQMVNII